MEAICPACQKKFPAVRQELAGKKAKCTCGHIFVLGQLADPTPSTTKAQPNDDSVDLSSANVFENSYSDLDQILAGGGSTAPLPSQNKNAGSEAAVRSEHAAKTKPHNAANQKPNSDTRPTGYGNTGMSVGFIAAVLSGSMAAWFSIFLLASRYSVLEYWPLKIVSQTFHDIARATFGVLPIGAGLERSFIVLGWVIFSFAMCLFVLSIGQLVNAFAKLFRRQHLFRGIDGITGLMASLMLFTVLSTLFFHSSHMSELNRDVARKAGRTIDENTAIGRNLLELRSKHATHSRRFVTCISVAAAMPLCTCLLSLTRVYITLGETEPTTQTKKK